MRAFFIVARPNECGAARAWLAHAATTAFARQYCLNHLSGNRLPCLGARLSRACLTGRASRDFGLEKHFKGGPR